MDSRADSDGRRIFPGATLWPGSSMSTMPSSVPGMFPPPLHSSVGFPIPMYPTSTDLFRPYLSDLAASHPLQTNISTAGSIKEQDLTSHTSVSPENKGRSTSDSKSSRKNRDKSISPKSKTSPKESSRKSSPHSSDNQESSTPKPAGGSGSHVQANPSAAVVSTSPGGSIYSMYPGAEASLAYVNQDGTNVSKAANSLSYYHSLYSYSRQMSASQQGRKVHATSTYMPEVGTMSNVWTTSPSMPPKSSPTHKKSNSHSPEISRKVHSDSGPKAEKQHKRCKNSSPELSKHGESAIMNRTEDRTSQSSNSEKTKITESSSSSKVPSSGQLVSLINTTAASKQSSDRAKTTRSPVTSSSIVTQTTGGLSVSSKPKTVVSTSKSSGDTVKNSEKSKSKSLKTDEKSSNSVTSGNIPVGIAVARKRQDTKNSVAETTTTSSGSWPGTRDVQTHSHSSRASRDGHDVATMMSTAAINPPQPPSGLGSNLVITGGTGLLGPGQPPMWYGLPPMYHPSTMDPSHMMPPSGYRVCQHPLTGQMMILPSLDAQHMWPYLGPTGHHMTPHSAIPHSLNQETNCGGRDNPDPTRLIPGATHPYLPSIPMAPGQPYAIPAPMPFYFPPTAPIPGMANSQMMAQLSGMDVNVLSRGTSPFDESMMPSPVKSEKSAKSCLSLKTIKEEKYPAKDDNCSVQKMSRPAGSVQTSETKRPKVKEQPFTIKEDECKESSSGDKSPLSDSTGDNEILDVTTVDEAEVNSSKSILSLTHVDGLELLSTLAEQKRQVEVKCPVNKLEEFVQVTEKVSKLDTLNMPRNPSQSKLDDLIKVTEALESSEQSTCDSNLPIKSCSEEPIKSKFDDLVKVTEDRYWERVTPPIDCPLSVDINENYKPQKKRRKSTKTTSYFVKKEERETELPISPPLIAMDTMDAMEIEYRLRLSELQRRYKEKQRELARLQKASRERHHMSDSSDKSGKRGPGRPKKRKALTGNTRGRKPSNKPKADSPTTGSPTHTDSISSVEKSKHKAKQLKTKSERDHVKLSKDVDTTDKVKLAEKMKAKKKLLMSKNIQLNKKKKELQSTKKEDDSHLSLKTVKPVKHTKSTDSNKTPKVKKHSLDTVLSDKKLNLSSEPPNKKRKVGRPKKFSPEQKQGTETIFSKKSKSLSKVVQLSQSKPKLMEQLSIDTEFGNKLPFIDESWHRRRSERIFLSDASPQPSPTLSHKSDTSSINLSPSRPVKQPVKRRNSLSQAWRAKYLNTVPSDTHDKSPVKRVVSEESCSDSEADDLPLSAYVQHQQQQPEQQQQQQQEQQQQKIHEPEEEKEEIQQQQEEEQQEQQRPETPKPRSTIITAEQLHNGLRVLVPMEGLFYEGEVREIQPPDVYGIVIDGERGGRPHIYSQEELLKEVILDVQPSSRRFLTEGTRICAYWSQQFSCLYPGTVDSASPNPDADPRLICVEFDDGDTGKIPIEHIHMLPADYPVVEYDPNPLFLIGRRRTSAASEIMDFSSQIKERRSSAPSALSPLSPADAQSDKKVKRGPGRPPKKVARMESLDAISENDVFLDDDSTVKPFAQLPETVKWSKQVDRMGNKCEEKSRDIKPRPAKFVYEESNKNGGVVVSPSKENKWMFVDDGVHRRMEIADSVNEQKIKKQNKRFERSLSGNKNEGVLPPRQLWEWLGSSTKRPGLKGKARKEFYKAINRGKETIRVGDSAIFLTTGRPHLPYIGHIISMWEGWAGNMVVKVRWFYHPEETKGAARKLAGIPGALYQSSHEDENDVQTISHKCEVLPYDDYTSRVQHGTSSNNTYYLAGYYDPVNGAVSQADTLMQI